MRPSSRATLDVEEVDGDLIQQESDNATLLFWGPTVRRVSLWGRGAALGGRGWQRCRAFSAVKVAASERLLSKLTCFGKEGSD